MLLQNLLTRSRAHGVSSTGTRILRVSMKRAVLTISFLLGYADATVLPLLPPVRGLYQIRYTYDKDHTHLLEMLQYLLYTVRYDRLYLDHLENNDKGNR